jgi:vitamin B12 transport system ATP-binding protein
MITVNNLSVLGRLFPVSFSLDKGEILHLVGPNGSGKSSLLSGLAGIIPISGEVLVDDVFLLSESIERQASLRGFLTQDERPSFNIDVYQYLRLSVPDKVADELNRFSSVVEIICQRLSLIDKLGSSIFHLSGGEWQRVRLAGICLQIWPELNPNAKLIILDEPAAALDIGQEKMLYELLEDVSDYGISVIMANHDLNKVLHHADKALLLSQGRQIAYGNAVDIVTDSMIQEVFHTSVNTIYVNGKYHLLFD